MNETFISSAFKIQRYDLIFIWLKKQVLRTTNIIELVKTEKWALPSLVIYLPDTTAPKDEILTITLVSNIGLW